MGWPRSNEVMRLYQDRQDKSFMIVDIADGLNPGGLYDAVSNVLKGDKPSLGSCCLSPRYLLDRCRRVEWSDLPSEWQDAFTRWLEGFHPSEVRGFWRVGNMPRESLDKKYPGFTGVYMENAKP